MSKVCIFFNKLVQQFKKRWTFFIQNHSRFILNLSRRTNPHEKTSNDIPRGQRKTPLHTDRAFKTDQLSRKWLRAHFLTHLTQKKRQKDKKKKNLIIRRGCCARDSQPSATVTELMIQCDRDGDPSRVTFCPQSDDFQVAWSLH